MIVQDIIDVSKFADAFLSFLSPRNSLGMEQVNIDQVTSQEA